MANIYRCGAEEQTITAGVEVSATSNTPTIDTVIKHSGAASFRSNKGAAVGAVTTYFFAASDQTGVYYFRAYFFFSTLPGTDSRIIQIQNSTGTTKIAIDILGANQFLSLINTEDSLTIGTGSTAVTTNTWYRIELKVDSTTISATACEVKLDGVVQASGNADLLTGISRMRCGSGNNPSNIDIYWDDMAINDSTGADQNGYPGPASIIHLRPNAAGDSNSFVTQTGGTAGAANNFTRVNEVTPNDATSFNGDVTLGNTDDFNLDNSTGISPYDVISLVSVGVRFAAAVAVTVASFQVRVKKTSGGTVSASSSITPNSTSYSTNAIADPRLSPLTLYRDPDGNAWTKATLDTAELGYAISATNTNAANISTIYLQVEFFTPTIGGTTTSTSSTSSTTFSTSSTSSSTSISSTSFSSTSTSASTSSTSTSTSSTSSSISSTSSSTSSTSSSSTSSSTSVSSTSSSISSTSQSSTSQSSTSSSSSISSTSTSFSSTSSSVSSTSQSTSSTSLSSTSSSSSTSTTAIPLNLDYTYQDTLTLPTTSTDEIDLDTSKNYQNVAVDDGDYFIQYGSEDMIQEYKKKNTNNTDVPSLIWKGRSTYDTRVSPLIIQIFNQSALSTIIDSYSEANFDGTTYSIGGAGLATAGGQAFTGSGLTLGGAKFYLKKTGSPTGSAVATIYASTGTYGSNATATGVALATSDNFDVSTISTTISLLQFTFSAANKISLTNGTHYIAAVEYTGGDASNLINIGSDATTVNHAGNSARKITGTWGFQGAADTPFYIQASGAWETLAVINNVPPDTDLTVTATQPTNVSNYYDSNNIVTFRIYQKVI